jgi:DedD protein
MSSSASPEASEIRRRGRQRLIGAIIIAVLLVVFVPMIFDSEPKSNHAEPSIEIPRKDNAPPLPAPPPAVPAKTPDVAPVKTEAQPEPAKAPDAPPAKAAPAKPTPAKAGAQAPAKPAPPPKLEGFAVQVGAFREEDKLKQAREKLVAAGLKHYTERIAIAKGEVTRLRAGPFPTRDAAEKAMGALKAQGLDGKVVPLP